jgi:hypothetical protein
VEGKPANVVVKDPEPIKIKRVREKGLYEDCKTKQKVQITSKAVFKMVSIKPGKIQEKSKPKARKFTYWQYVKGLADTPCTDIPTAKEATDYIYNLFFEVFPGSAAEMLGSQDTVGNITDYLKYDSELLAWNHIGFGSPYNLIFWDEKPLTYLDVQNLDPSWGIECAVILIIANNSFNDPLKTAFLGKNPRTYIGGTQWLPIGPSEATAKCFWKAVLLENKPMDKALADCSAAQGLSGYFDLAGDSGPFWK